MLKPLSFLSGHHQKSCENCTRHRPVKIALSLLPNVPLVTWLTVFYTEEGPFPSCPGSKNVAPLGQVESFTRKFASAESTKSL
jgi:hypothetical protein